MDGTVFITEGVDIVLSIMMTLMMSERSEVMPTATDRIERFMLWGTFLESIQGDGFDILLNRALPPQEAGGVIREEIVAANRKLRLLLYAVSSVNGVTHDQILWNARFFGVAATNRLLPPGASRLWITRDLALYTIPLTLDAYFVMVRISFIPWPSDGRRVILDFTPYDNERMGFEELATWQEQRQQEILALISDDPHVDFIHGVEGRTE